MKISKTQFKEYTKCKAFASLDEIYYKKDKADQDKEDIKTILQKMFNEDGEDEIRVPDEQLELLLPYYKDVERIALREASRILGKEFKYSENNNEQMKISFRDKNGNQFYTYLDGYYEDDEEINIIEVKATTNSKFLKLGPTKKGEFLPIFDDENNVLKIKQEVHNDKNMTQFYNKLFDRYDACGKYTYDIAVSNYIMNGFRMENHRLFHKKVKYYLYENLSLL